MTMVHDYSAFYLLLIPNVTFLWDEHLQHLSKFQTTWSDRDSLIRSQKGYSFDDPNRVESNLSAEQSSPQTTIQYKMWQNPNCCSFELN